MAMSAIIHVAVITALCNWQFAVLEAPGQNRSWASAEPRTQPESPDQTEEGGNADDPSTDVVEGHVRAMEFIGMSSSVPDENLHQFIQLAGEMEWESSEQLASALDELEALAEWQRSMRMQGILWCDDTSHFCTVIARDPPANNGDLDSEVLIRPYRFPAQLSYVCGISPEIAWFGSTKRLVTVDPLGSISYNTQAYLNLFSQVSNLTFDPDREIERYSLNGMKIVSDVVVPGGSTQKSCRVVRLHSQEDESWVYMIGTWPIGLDTQSQSDWAKFAFRDSPGSSSAHFMRYHVVEVQPLEYMTIPANRQELLATFSPLPEIMNERMFKER